MSLTFGYSSPKDLMAKAKRDQARLAGAEARGDLESMADALLDVSVTVLSLKDWLKKHPSSSYSASDVEAFMLASTALLSLRDVANAGKHRVITHYAPSVTDVDSSVVTVVDPTLGTQFGQAKKVKISRTDGSRQRASDLVQTALGEWEHFMRVHGVSA